MKTKKEDNFKQVATWTILVMVIVLLLFWSMASVMLSPPPSGSPEDNMFVYFAIPFVVLILVGLVVYYIFTHRKKK